MEPNDSAVLGLLRQFHSELGCGRMPLTEWEKHFLRIGARLVMERRDTLRAIVNLPALRASTREEVYRRLLRGRDFLLASLQDPIRLRDVAQAANLSPFHFHRSFARVFRETPHQYLTRHRLEMAARLLRSTELSVTAVGLEAGGLYAALAILAGLTSAARTGKGVLVDVAEADAAVAWTANTANAALNGLSLKAGQGMGESVRYSYYRTQDDKLVIFQASSKGVLMAGPRVAGHRPAVLARGQNARRYEDCM